MRGARSRLWEPKLWRQEENAKKKSFGRPPKKLQPFLGGILFVDEESFRGRERLQVALGK